MAGLIISFEHYVPTKGYLGSEWVGFGNFKRFFNDVYFMVAQSYYKELLQYCVILIATLPILCSYPFLQKYFVKGVMVGAIKG